MKVYIVREKNGKVKTWLSDRKVADYLAKKLEGTTEERLAINEEGTTFIVGELPPPKGGGFLFQ